MHADEAVQADRFGSLLERHSIPYDPAEHHGPLLAYATLPEAWIARQWRYADLTEWTIRAAPALAGLALVLMSFALGKTTGALFTAVSPILVYYSRYYIPEMFLVLLSACLLLCVLRYQEAPGLRWALPAGIVAGLMYATKETAVLVFLAVAAACLAARFRFRLVDLGVTALAAIALVAMMLRPATALLTYAARAASGGGHAHPWYYYLQTLTPAGDILWLPAVLFLARRNRMVIFLGGYAAALTVVYSVLPYKTPWCAAGMVHGWILTAAAGLSTLPEPRWRRAALAGALLLVLQAVRYAFPLAADPRNPYAYAHTTRDVYEIRDRLREVGGYGTRIEIVTGENWWPLPWYLRRYPEVRWWSVPPGEGRVGPVILCSPANEDAVARLLYELPPPGERELYVSLFSRAVWLRPGIEVRGYVAASAAPPSAR